MSTPYAYNVSQTANGKVNPDILAQQVADGSFPSGGAFAGIELVGGVNEGRGLFTGGTLTLSWTNPLDSTDLAAQNALITTHVGQQFSKTFRRRGTIPLQSDDTGNFTSALSAPLSLSPLAPGIWQLSFYCEVRLQAPSTDPSELVQMQITDGGSSVVDASWDTDQWFPISGQRIFDREAGDSFTFDLLFRQQGGVTVDIRRVQIQVQLIQADE